MRYMARIAAALVVVALLFACSREVGTNFDLAKADQFRPGVTTYDEAVRQLGKPTSVSKLARGQTVVMWQYARGTVAGSQGKAVTIVFDTNDVMVRTANRTEVGGQN